MNAVRLLPIRPASNVQASNLQPEPVYGGLNSQFAPRAAEHSGQEAEIITTRSQWVHRTDVPRNNAARWTGSSADQQYAASVYGSSLTVPPYHELSAA